MYLYVSSASLFEGGGVNMIPNFTNHNNKEKLHREILASQTC